MRRILCFIALLCSFLVFSQMEIVFDYDESGNQVYRGELASNTSVNHSTQPNNPNNPINPSSNAGMSPEEIAFWKNITIGPNPVIHTLYVDINSEAKKSIHQIILYDTFGTPIRKISNISSLPQRIEVDMRAYNIGVYYISFHLKNGHIYTSSTILKH